MMRRGILGILLLAACVCATSWLPAGELRAAPGPCGEGQIIADHLSTSVVGDGEVLIEQCVTRTDDGTTVTDTYTYTVTNLSSGHDLCKFVLPNNIGATGPLGDSLGWIGTWSATAWTWEAPSWTNGIAIGHSGTFWYSVTGPTSDATVTGQIGLCYSTVEIYDVVTTGPSSLCGKDQNPVDVTLSHTPYGDVQIEECVTRSPDGQVDTYCYRVTNLSFVQDACGLCMFGVENTCQVPTLPGSQNGPTGWSAGQTFTHAPFGPGWEWRAPSGSCGIMQGDSAVFCFSVAGPTSDVSMTGYVEPCKVQVDMGFEFRTTGPCREKCPDLTVTDVCGICQWEGNQCTFTIWATVSTIGNVPATSWFSVALTTNPSLGPIAPVPIFGNFMGTTTVTFTVQCTDPALCACPDGVEFTVTADSDNLVTECNENNNAASIKLCCPRPPAKCPDLTVACFRACCACQIDPVDASTCTVTAYVCVSNNGGADAGPFSVTISSAYGTGTAQVAGLTSMSTIVVPISFTFPCDPRVCHPCPFTLGAMVDSTYVVPECDETNNYSAVDICCSQ